MIKIMEDRLREKDLNYEEILNSIVSTVESSDIEIRDSGTSSSDDLIELEATIKQNSCDWTYRLSAYYKFNNDGTINYDAKLNLIEANGEMRESDATELANLLQDINEIMNV